MVGIAGGSGSGKSTLAARLAESVAPLRSTVIGLDSFFKQPEDMPAYFSTHHGEPRPNFNHPGAFRRHEMVRSCRQAANPAAGTTDGAEPAPNLIIIEGILALHFIELRPLMHLRCYVTVPVDQRLARRTERNLAAGYGGTAEEILWYNRECVVPEHQRFNAPTAAHADLLIDNADGAGPERDRAIADISDAIRMVTG